MDHFLQLLSRPGLLGDATEYVVGPHVILDELKTCTKQPAVVERSPPFSIRLFQVTLDMLGVKVCLPQRLVDRIHRRPKKSMTLI